MSNNFDDDPIFVARSYTNFGRVTTQGIDVGLNYYFVDDWTLAFTYSWFDFNIKNADSPFADQLLPNTPPNKLAAGITYAPNRWNFTFDVRWVDEFRWAVGPFQGQVLAYTTADLTANYDIDERFTVGLNATNLFDKQAWQSFGGDILGRRVLGSVMVGW